MTRTFIAIAVALWLVGTWHQPDVVGGLTVFAVGLFAIVAAVEGRV